jgi:hypothetical protein
LTLFGNDIGFAVYHPTTVIILSQVLADSGFDLGVERAHAGNLSCSMGFMPRRVNVDLEQPMELPRMGVCPRKPWPFGNEYHTACCGLSGIMFVMEMVEGKDHPPQVA